MKSAKQILFFEKLKAFIPSNLSPAEEISSVLNSSVDATYRRMRGESVLSFDDASLLCNRFKMPMSILQSTPSNVVGFQVNELTNKSESFEEYLIKMADDVELMTKFNDKHILYAAEDIPVFYHFLDRNLATFKVFYWMKAIQNVEGMENTVFNPEMYGDFLDRQAKRISHLYAQVPTTEIWTVETIESTISQIRFFWDAGFIEEIEYGKLICDGLSKLVLHIKRQTELGEKLNSNGEHTGQSYRLYMSDLMIGTNCVVCKIEDKRICYLSYNSFNSMKTSNDFFADQTETWLNNLISKSLLISGVAEKQRNQFFKVLLTKIDNLKSHIENS